MDVIISVVAVVLSLISIIVSVATYLDERKKTEEINCRNLEYQIYMDVFKEYMLKYLPNSRNKVWIDPEKKLRDYNELTNTLIDLKNSTLYFSYRNPSFYKELKEKIDSLDDFLVKHDGKVLNGIEVSEFYHDLDQMLSDVYDIIIKNAFGKN